MYEPTKVSDMLQDDLLNKMPAVVVYRGKILISATLAHCGAFAEDYARKFGVDPFRIEVYVVYPGRVLPNIGGRKAVVDYVTSTMKSVKVGFKKVNDAKQPD